MRRVKSIILWSLGLLLLSAAVIAVLLATAGDGFYRWAAGKLVEGSFDRKIHMDGTFSFHVGLEPSLVITDVWIENAPWAEKKDMGRVERAEVQIALKPLFSGIVLLPRLVVEGLTLDLETGPDGEGNWEVAKASSDDEDTPGRKDLFVPLLEFLSLKDIAITYRDRQSGRDTEVLLQSLQTKRTTQEASLAIQGKGSLNQIAFQIKGQFGSIEDALAATAPYPLELTLATSGLVAELTGTAQNFAEAEGLDLRFSGKLGPEALRLRHDLLQELPQELRDVLNGMVRLDLAGRITGDLKTPDFDKLQARLEHRSGADLSLQGHVALANSEDGMALTGLGATSTLSLPDPALLEQALGTRLPDLGAIHATSELSWAQDWITLRSFQVEAASFESLQLSAEGRLGKLLAKERDFELDPQLDLSASMKQSGPLSLFAEPSKEAEPPSKDPLETPLSGTSVIDPSGPPPSPSTKEDTRSSDDDMVLLIQQGLKAVGLHPGPTDGKMGPHTRAAIEAYQAKYGLAVNGHATEQLLHHLQRELGIHRQQAATESGGTRSQRPKAPLPELGPVMASGRLSGREGTFRLDDLRLTLGAKDAPLVVASGTVGSLRLDQPLGDLDLKVSFTLPSSTVGQVLDASLPDLGVVSVRAKLSGSSERATLEVEELTAGEKSSLLVKAKGSLDIRETKEGLGIASVDLGVQAESTSTKRMAGLFKQALPELGELSGRFRLHGNLSKLGVSDIQMRVQDGEGLQIHASGTVARIFPPSASGLQGVDIGLNAQARSTASVGQALGVSMPDLGAVSAHGRLSDRAGSLGLEALKLDLTKQGYWSLNATGSLGDVLRGEKLDVTLAFNSPDPQKVAALFEQDLGRLSPLQGTARLMGRPEKATLNATIAMGETHVSADLTGNLSGGRPNIKGAINIPVLYLRNIGIAPGEASVGEERQTTSKHRGPLFSKEPWDTSALGEIDLSLVVRIEEIIGKDLSIDRAGVTLRLEDSNLRLHPAKLVFGGGDLSVDFGFNAKNTPKTFLKVTGDNVRVGAVMEQIETKVPIKGGFLNVFVDLESNGLSPDQWASNLKGRVGLAGEDLKVLRTLLDLLAVDVFGWTLHHLLPGKRYVDLPCTIARLTAREGTLTVDEMFSQGLHFKLRGKGTVDLQSETLDMTLYPKKRSKLFGTVTPITIKGDLASPSVSAIPLTAAAIASLEAAFIPEITLPLRALGYLRELVEDRKHSPCLEAERWGRVKE